MHTKKELQALLKLPLVSKQAFVAISGQQTFVGLTIMQIHDFCVKHEGKAIELLTIQNWAKRELKKLS